MQPWLYDLQIFLRFLLLRHQLVQTHTLLFQPIVFNVLLLFVFDRGLHKVMRVFGANPKFIKKRLAVKNTDLLLCLELSELPTSFIELANQRIYLLLSFLSRGLKLLS